jgi:hypothetical protein
MLEKKNWALVLALFLATGASSVLAQIGDGPVIRHHVTDSDVANMSFQELSAAGRELFIAKFNMFDGRGRPATTGGGAARDPEGQPAFIRTSAPDSNSCAGCHNDPVVGAAGDIVANVFVLAQTLDPVTESVSPEFSNNRNTLGMHGSGAIELLAREMTWDLLDIRAAAIAEAADAGADVTRSLVAKGVSFGTITAHADGSVDNSGIEGIDADLIIKPFHQKGAVISLREFTNNAMNHHHGMQAVERFGKAITGTDDFDQDGVPDELTVGDITACTIWQAQLGTPGQVIPSDPPVALAVIRGERTFSRLGCGDCHVPSMTLESTIFTEPSPLNPAGNLRVADVTKPYEFDLTDEAALPHIEKRFDGKGIVRAFTDLKRHNLCDEELNHYCNEMVVQGGVATEEFLSRKLWDVGNTAPYGHVGDLSTLTEAIYWHGGEARGSRDAFYDLSQQGQDEVIEFLKSLQILPAGTQSLVVDETGQTLNKAALAKKLESRQVRGSETIPTDRR